MAKQPSGKTFEVVDALDLFRKLEWEYDRLRAVSIYDASVERSYLALNAAMTAWHMTDWLCARFEREHYKKLSSHAGVPIDNCKVFRAWVLGQRAISTCEQISVAGKHFNIDERTHKVTTKAEVIDSPFRDPQPLNYLMVIDHNSRMPIESVIGFALAFWRMVFVGVGLASEQEVAYPMPPRKV